jgi:hypothetical protein
VVREAPCPVITIRVPGARVAARDAGPPSREIERK